jgi:multiple sugar transport system ATP-binding protein
LLHRKPHELSGGERQRVALGRAIVRNPAAFLFDEPLSNLDAKLRQQMRTELKQLHESLAATMIYVTHDQIEAMTLGQRVVVMDRGRIQQIAPPQVVYREPANLFVARFFGSTPLNLVNGNLERTADELEFVCGPCRLKLTGELRSAAARWPRQITLGFRGEDLRLTGESSQAGWELPVAEVTQVDRWGDASVVYFRWAEDVLVAKLAGDVQTRVGDRLRFSLEAERGMWFDTATELNLVKNNNERQ